MVSYTNGVDVTTFKTKLEYGQIYSHMYIDIMYEMTILFVGHTGFFFTSQIKCKSDATMNNILHTFTAVIFPFTLWILCPF